MNVPDGKKVILRLDLDVKNDTDLRLVSSVEVIKYLIEKKSKVIIIGHKGRPKGKIDNSLSLSETAKNLSVIINKEIKFIYDITGVEAQEECQKLREGEVLMLENLRFDSREEENDDDFSKALASLGEFYVNDAFGVSHRQHASIVGIPKYLPHTFGLRFEKEIENLQKILKDPKKPVLFLLSGVKEDKLSYLDGIKKFADKVLIAGRLPEYMGDARLESVRLQPLDAQVIIGNLTMDKEDITLNTVQRFESEVKKAGTIVVSGPMGKFEDEGHRQGTIGVFNAIKKSNAFKIAGGGDTEVALNTLNMSENFDWISVGGGAMLTFLVNGTLPGIEALLE